jgi:hypothetical protein
MSVASRAMDRLPSLPKDRELIIHPVVAGGGEELVIAVTPCLKGHRLARSASPKINGRWYRYQRPLRLTLEVLGPKAILSAFRRPAPRRPEGRRFA